MFANLLKALFYFVCSVVLFLVFAVSFAVQFACILIVYFASYVIRWISPLAPIVRDTDNIKAWLDFGGPAFFVYWGYRYCRDKMSRSLEELGL
jgi:hypothetical protein